MFQHFAVLKLQGYKEHRCLRKNVPHRISTIPRKQIEPHVVTMIIDCERSQHPFLHEGDVLTHVSRIKEMLPLRNLFWNEGPVEYIVIIF